MPQEQPAEEKKPNYWVIGLIVVLIIAALGAGAYFITRAGSDDEVGYVDLVIKVCMYVCIYV